MRLVNGFLRVVPVLGICVASLLCPMATRAASFTIDKFTDTEVGTSQTVTQSTPGSSTDLDSGLSDVVGGKRELFINLTADPNPSGGSTSVFTTTTRLSVSLGDSVNGTGGSLYPSLLGVDITLGELPANAFFQAKILSADQNVFMKVEITDTAAAGGDTATFDSAALVTNSFVNQALGGFTNAGAVDFTQVDQIRITLSGPTAFDASISLLEITTTPSSVPEPSTWALGLIGLSGVGLVAYRRRRA